MKAMADEGKLGVRLWVMVRAGLEQEAQKLAQYRMVDYGNGHLTVRAIKRSIDGALGSRGAWLLEPYADKPDSAGLNTTSVEDIRATAKLAMQHGYQLCVHAIGDRANRETLNIFEDAFKANPEKKDLRWRVEHAQHLHPSDIPRFGALGRDCLDGGHALHVGRPVRAGAAGPEARRRGRVRLAEADASPAPSSPTAPTRRWRMSIRLRATTPPSAGRLKDGSVFYPDQRMSRMEALKSYTINGAFAAFEDGSKGSLKPGKYADVVVLSKDIMTIPEDEIPTAQVVYTVVGGKVRYKK